MSAVLDYLPRGNTLSDEAWQRRHKLLQWILAAHLPALFLFGVARGYLPADVAETLALPLACLIVGHLLRSRRLAAASITLGLVYCSAALVGFSNGAIEAHFHFFIMIGFIALYQDWVPFLLNILFTVLSHGIGSSFVPNLMFNHASAQQHPWEWSLLHGVAVLAACVGVVLFWKVTEDEQNRSLTLTRQLADAEIGRRRFTSDLLVNLARRNQNLLYRQLDLLNDLEDKEHDPDALANLFRLDHLATRIRRNAESLLVLSGEESPRTWRDPVQLVDVVRAGIAEIEDLNRVDDAIDETLAVSGRSVADLTHLFAELLENAVHFSPPGVAVVVRTRPLPSSPGTHLVTIEDWGVGMTPQELADANERLRTPREVDLSLSQRLGLHVVARLAQRYGITVELTPTPGGGVTAVTTLPPVVFQQAAELVGVGAAPMNGYGALAVRPPAVRASAVRAAALGESGASAGASAAGASAAGASAAGASAAGASAPVIDAPVIDAPVIDAPALGAAGFSAPARGWEAGAGYGTPVAGTPALPGNGTPGNGTPGLPVNGTPALPGGPAQPGNSSPGVPGNALPGNGSPGVPGNALPGNGNPGLASRAPGEALARTRPARPALPDGWAEATGRRRPMDSADRPATEQRTGTPETGPDGFRGPTPAGGDGAAQPGYRPRGENGNGNWSSWWTRATPGQAADPYPQQPGQPAPEPQPEPNGSTPAGPEPTDPSRPDPSPLPEPRPPADEGPQLHRRVPQANLAAGLRREGEQAAPEQTPVVRDPMAARNALSRFQAAQRAARDVVDDDQPDGGPPR